MPDWTKALFITTQIIQSGATNEDLEGMLTSGQLEARFVSRCHSFAHVAVADSVSIEDYITQTNSPRCCSGPETRCLSSGERRPLVFSLLVCIGESAPPTFSPHSRLG